METTRCSETRSRTAMDLSSKLEQLELSRDEVSRFSEAMKDETFRGLLSEYAEEISNPENRKLYEEQIVLLEKNRGMNVHFLHPEPHHVLKTRSDGGKIFINVCSNPLVHAPTSEPGRDGNGVPGRQWSLPSSLTPGRRDLDARGEGCTVYDVLFHPDVLLMAGQNSRFMGLVNSSALDVLEKSFALRLERGAVKTLKMRYKGRPHPAVIRRPIAGHPEEQEPLEELLRPCDPPPAVPEYSVKYRRVVELQDYSRSRDASARHRPSHVVLVVELPELRSARRVDVQLQERRLVLECPEPAYRLEVALSYPVNQDTAQATFNSSERRLTITLAVLPPDATEEHLQAEEPDIQNPEDSLTPAAL